MQEFTFLINTTSKPSSQDRRLALSHARYHAARASRRKKDAEEKASVTESVQGTTAVPSTQVSDSGTEVPSLTITLYRGNSDPFAASAGLTVTPRISEVINFLQDVYIPSIYPDGPSWIRKHTTTHFFQDQTRLILNHPSASSELLPYLTMLAVKSGGGDLQSEALSSQLQIIRRIRESMDDLTIDQHKILLLVKALFCSAVAEHTWAAAESHGAILNTLLHRKIDHEGWSAANQDLLINCLFYSLNLAHMTLRKSVLDIGGWIDECHRDTAEPVLDYLAPLHDKFDRRLDASIGDKRLRDTYRGLQETVWLWHQRDRPASDITQLCLNQYCCLEHNVLLSRLVNHYVRFKGELAGAGRTVPPEREAYLVAQAVLALSLLAFMATFSGNPKIGMQFVWQKHSVFLSEMQTLLCRKLRDGYSLAEGHYKGTYRNALVWAYWVGATWEFADVGLGKGLTQSWYRTMFGEQCQKMNLQNWAQVEGLLRGFAEVKFAQPRGSVWVQCFLGRRRVLS